MGAKKVIQQSKSEQKKKATEAKIRKSLSRANKELVDLINGKVKATSLSDFLLELEDLFNGPITVYKKDRSEVALNTKDWDKIISFFKNNGVKIVKEKKEKTKNGTKEIILFKIPTDKKDALEIIYEKTKTGYSAYVSGIPGCIATAPTKKAVKRKIEEALIFHFEGLQKVSEFTRDKDKRSKFYVDPILIKDGTFKNKREYEKVMGEIWKTISQNDWMMKALALKRRIPENKNRKNKKISDYSLQRAKDFKKVIAYIRKQIREDKPIDREKLKGFRIVAPLENKGHNKKK